LYLEAKNGNLWFTFNVFRYRLFQLPYHSQTDEVPCQFQSAMAHSQVQWACRISGGLLVVNCFLEPAGVAFLVRIRLRICFFRQILTYANKKINSSPNLLLITVLFFLRYIYISHQRKRKIAEIKVFLTFFLVDGRIRIRIDSTALYLPDQLKKKDDKE
jgi:hypothetical protein